VYGKILRSRTPSSQGVQLAERRVLRDVDPGTLE
jgi:hypothetical protein